jgi:hypothetical protein
MKALKTALGSLAATIAVLAFPLAAQAEYLVPPGNSAATQYTEAVPTAGGPKASGKPRHNQAQTPDEVLGSHTVEKLDAQGPQGHAAAEVAAATAPSTAVAAPTASQHEAGRADDRGDSKSGGSGNGAAPRGSDGAAAGKESPPAQQTAGGSSGLGEVIGQATGSSSSGQLGLLLPLIVLATLAWAVAFFLRQRKRPTV